MQKANDALRKELSTLAAAAQKKDATEDLGRYIPAKYSNINEKLVNVIDWFDDKIPTFKKISTTVNHSRSTIEDSNILDQDSIDKQADIKRRCVVFTVCISENIINQGSNEALTALLNALEQCQDKLKPNDYICFNIGNSSHKMTFDFQKNITDWQKVMQQFMGFNENIDAKESMKMFNQFVDIDNNLKDNNENQERSKKSQQKYKKIALIQSIFAISINGAFFFIYLYEFLKIIKTPSGDCYGSLSYVPLFNNPPTGPIDFTRHQKYEYHESNQESGRNTLRFFTNVSKRMLVHILIEMICNFLAICRLLWRLKFKMSKGFGAKVEDLYKYSQFVRLINFVFLTTFFFGNETQLCFCSNRPFFFEHCYFVDLEFEEYQCYPYDRKSVWGKWAEADFKSKFPTETFNLIERSLYECLSGDDYEMQRIDKTDTTYRNK